MRTYVVAALALASAAGSAYADGVLRHDDGSARGELMSTSFADLRPLGGGFMSRGGGVVYNNSTQTGFRYTPGGAAPADNRRVAFDDVPIPAATLGANTVLDVCKVTVGIRRLAGAPATDVNVFWSTLSTGPTAPDTELDSPGTALGTVSLPANGAASVTTLVTFGASGGPTLFSVPLNTTLLAGFGTFALGVGLSDTGGLNGWRLTSGPDLNANVFWQYDPFMTGQPNPEGAFNFGATGPAATFYIVIEGTPVPTPGALALLGLGGLVATRRRR